LASNRTQCAFPDGDYSAGIRTCGCSPVEDTRLQATRNSHRASSTKILLNRTQVRLVVQYRSEVTSVYALEWKISVVVLGVYCEATAAQPQKQQGRYQTAGLPDISQLRPQLQQEWHPDNNALLGSIKIKPHSSMKIKWSCPNCPAGYSHIWQATVNNRTRGTKCPFCQGQSLCQHNSLATKAPRQTRYWNHDKNAKTPEQTLAGSNFRAE